MKIRYLLYCFSLLLFTPQIVPEQEKASAGKWGTLLSPLLDGEDSPRFGMVRVLFCQRVACEPHLPRVGNGEPLIRAYSICKRQKICFHPFKNTRRRWMKLEENPRPRSRSMYAAAGTTAFPHSTQKGKRRRHRLDCGRYFCK